VTETLNIDNVCRGLRILFAPEQVIEVRALKKLPGGRNRTDACYVTNLESAAKAISKLNESGCVERDERLNWDGIYYVLNPFPNAILSRHPANKIIRGINSTVGDADILRRRWFFIDFDPDRLTGISSTTAELLAAKDAAHTCREWLNGLGFPPPFMAMSGNGYHLLYRIDEPNDKETTDLIQGALRAIIINFKDGIFKRRFKDGNLPTGENPFHDARVKIDEKVFNAGRIIKAYGTKACKGLDTAERPHRWSKITGGPEGDLVQIVDRALLEKLANLAPQKATKRATSSKGIDCLKASPEEMEWAMERAEIGHGGALPYGDGTKWQLNNCVFNEAHTKPDSYIALYQSGATDYHCSHDSCKDNKWKQFRAWWEEWTGEEFPWLKRRTQIKTKESSNRDFEASDALSTALPDVAVSNTEPEVAQEEKAAELVQIIKDTKSRIYDMLYKTREHGDGLPPKSEAKFVVNKTIADILEKYFKVFKNSAGTNAYIVIPKEIAHHNLPRVIRIGEDNGAWTVFMKKYFGVNKRETVYSYVTAQLEEEVKLLCASHPVHELGIFDKRIGTLYFSLGGHNVARITSDGRIEFIENGDDNKFFVVNQDSDPVDVEKLKHELQTMEGRELNPLDAETETPFTRYMFHGVPFGENESLTPRLAAKLILGGAILLPFGDYIAEKPVFHFVGDNNTGKTHLFRKILYLVYGPRMEVTALGMDPKDFTTALVNNYALFIDDQQDVDNYQAQANAKKLTQSATGGKVRGRKYYTTGEQVSFPFTAWTWISALTVFNKATDLFSRMFLIKFEGYINPDGELQGTKELQDYVEEHRPALLAEYLFRLSGIVRASWANRGKKYGCRHRMSQWFNICYRTSDCGPECEREVNEWRAVEAAVCATKLESELDDLLHVIRLWVASDRNNHRAISRDDFLRELREIANDRGHRVRCLEVVGSGLFNKAMSDLRRALVQDFGYLQHNQTRKHGNMLSLNLGDVELATLKESLKPRFSSEVSEITSVNASDRVMQNEVGTASSYTGEDFPA
jgi:hypothetical protein